MMCEVVSLHPQNIIDNLQALSHTVDNLSKEFEDQSRDAWASFNVWCECIKETVLEIAANNFEYDDFKPEVKVPAVISFLEKRNEKNGRGNRERQALLPTEYEREHLHENKTNTTSYVSKCEEQTANSEENKIFVQNISENINEKSAQTSECSVKKSFEVFQVRYEPGASVNFNQSRECGGTFNSFSGTKIISDDVFKTPTNSKGPKFSSSTPSHPVKAKLKESFIQKSIVKESVISQQFKRKSSEMNENLVEGKNKRQKITAGEKEEIHLPTSSSLVKTYSENVPRIIAASQSDVKSRLNMMPSLPQLEQIQNIQNPRSGTRKKRDEPLREEMKENENLKKVLTLRQMKIQENKRKREEKMEKTMLQRKKLEKEKEERLKHCHAKSQRLLLKEKETTNKLATVVKTRSRDEICRIQQGGLASKGKKTPITKAVAKQENSVKPLSLRNAKEYLKVSDHEVNKTYTAKSSNSEKTPIMKNEKKRTSSKKKNKTPATLTQKVPAVKPQKKTPPSVLQKEVSSSKRAKEETHSSYIKKKSPTPETQKEVSNTLEKQNSHKSGEQASGKDVNNEATAKASSFVSYEISDGENSGDEDDVDETASRKPIPYWAQGDLFNKVIRDQDLRLKNKSLNPDELFGTVVDPPDLEKIFNISKKRYRKRTSSAIWNSPIF